MAALGLSACFAQVDGLAVGRNFAPCVVQAQEGGSGESLPAWLPSDPVVDPASGSVEISVPALTRQTAATRFVLSVLFDDAGDGGPSVEWRRQDGTLETISEGLGEATDDRALGLNSQTVLLPEELTRSGGTAIVTYYGRFSALSTITLRPARVSTVTLTGSRLDPALVEDSLRVSTSEDVDGRRSLPLTGDLQRGNILEAELAAGIEEIPGELEFIVPLATSLEGVVLKTELLGLDLESSLAVEINGKPAGTLGLAPVVLDDPSVTKDASGRLVVAGWRAGSIFLASRHWQTGENRLVLKLVRSDADPNKPVFLRKTGLQVRLTETTAPTPAAGTDPALPAADSGDASPIDFLEPQPLIQPPAEPRLPQVITTY